MGPMQPRGEPKNQMILATTSSCCTSTRRATSSIAIYWWATRFAQNVSPTRVSSSLCASNKIWQVVFLFLSFFLFFSLFASFLFLLFASPTSLMPTTRYISTSASKFARKQHGANVQSPSNHQDLSSIGHGKHKGIVWLTMEWQGGKIREVIPFVDDLHPLLS